MKRLWCWLTSHNWQLFFCVGRDALPTFRLQNSEIACARCKHRVPSRIEERGNVLLAIPSYWPNGKIVPDWMIDSLRK